ncbi:MAG: OmpA family protein [Bacteroidota bacterium]
MKTILHIVFAWLLLISPLYSRAADSDTVPRNRSEAMFDQLDRQDQMLFKSNFFSADLFMSEGNYIDAIPLLEELNKISPANANVNFKIGICYSNIPSSGSKAIPYLMKAVQNFTLAYLDTYRESTSSVYSIFYLAKAYHNNYQFDKAIQYYQMFKKYIPAENTELLSDVNRRIEMVREAQHLQKEPLRVNVKNLGGQINSFYSDYCPVLSADGNTLYFTSRREGNVGGQKDETGKYYEDIYYSKKNTDGSWQPAVNMGSELNSKGHEAAVSISHDGNKLFVYRDDKGDGNIYVSNNVNGSWSSLKKLDETINTKSWESHAFLSADGNRLYFVSDRPGGFGGRDVYYSDKKKNGRWGDAVNLGSKINSRYDEDGPWISDDGMKIIFSSNGHNTMGGFDIFTSVMNEKGEWETPSNIGYPVNSTDDDVFFTYAPDRNSIYYSSGKNNGFGNEDLYEMKIIGPYLPYMNINGKVTDANTGNPINARIFVSDTTNNRVVADEISGANDKGYDIFLPVGKAFRVSVSAEGYQPYDAYMYFADAGSDGNTEKDFLLSPNAKNEENNNLIAVSLKNVFFDFNSYDIRLQEESMLLKVCSIMKQNSNIGIVVGAHTDIIGSYDYNMKLSEKRAASVMNYLTAQGISSERILTNYFGYAEPVTTNNNAAGRQLNRRAEFHLFFMSE